MSVGQRFGKFIKTSGNTQNSMSDILGTTRQTISLIVNNKARLTTDHLIVLKKSFPDLDLNWLVCGESVSSKVNIGDCPHCEDMRTIVNAIKETLKTKDDLIQSQRETIDLLKDKK